MKRIALFALPILVLIGLFAVFASLLGRDPNYVPSVFINKPVPEFELPAIVGLEAQTPSFSTADLTGSVFVVNVFASWCIPCRDEHPILIQLAKEFPNVQLYGINQKDQPEQAISFLNELGNPYHRIGADNNGRVSIEWGVYGVPETFVVNAEGIITYKHIGPISPDSYQTSLKPAIEAAIAN